jgi:Gpi18-like mannosyltransferase
MDDRAIEIDAPAEYPPLSGVAQVPSPASPPAQRQPGSSIGSGIDRDAAGLAILAELLTLVFGCFAFEVTSGRRVLSLHQVFDIWNWWDTGQYLSIAVHGYQKAGDLRWTIVFYPLYPWLVRITILFVRDPLISAFIVSFLASIGAAIALARLVAIDYPEPVAYRSVWFMFIFPTAYFLHIGYTESLFMALVICSFLAARRDRWLAASILGAGASLTRMNGLILIPALGVEALHRLRIERRWESRWLWLALIPSGFGLYLLINYFVTGDPFTFANYERSHWGQGLGSPWRQVRQMADVIVSNDVYNSRMIGLAALFFLTVGLIATVASFFMLRPSYSVWMAANWLLIASLTWDLSAPRYILTLFPIFILLARLARSRNFYAVVTIGWLLLMGSFITSFLSDRWAF